MAIVPPADRKPENLVTDPPLKSPVLLNDGRFSRPWAVWFQQLYIRTSFKGGNAIDNGLTSLDETIEQVNINTGDIATNLASIAVNAAAIAQNVSDIAANLVRIQDNDTDIAQNVADITTNAVNILANSQNLGFSRARIWGEVEPALYDDTSTTYARGDYVTRAALGGSNDFYYRAREVIAAPAGAFDPSKWEKVSLSDSWLESSHIAFGSVKAIVVEFEGTNSVGAVTPSFSYNVDTFERISTGVYEGAVLQSTFFGENIFTKAVPVLSHKIAASVNTDFFEIEYTDLGSGDFRLEVFEVTKGAGDDLVRTLYDPDTTGDRVSFTLLAHLGNGDLPPA